MEFFGLLTLGFFLGMSHAMEADHLAAVSSLWRAHHGRRTIMQSTFYWSAGHALTLLVFAVYCCCRAVIYQPEMKRCWNWPLRRW